MCASFSIRSAACTMLVVSCILMRWWKQSRPMRFGQGHIQHPYIPDIFSPLQYMEHTHSHWVLVHNDNVVLADV